MKKTAGPHGKATLARAQRPRYSAPAKKAAARRVKTVKTHGYPCTVAMKGIRARTLAASTAVMWSAVTSFAPADNDNTHVLPCDCGTVGVHRSRSQPPRDRSPCVQITGVPYSTDLQQHSCRPRHG